MVVVGRGGECVVVEGLALVSAGWGCVVGSGLVGRCWAATWMVCEHTVAVGTCLAGLVEHHSQ